MASSINTLQLRDNSLVVHDKTKKRKKKEYEANKDYILKFICGPVSTNNGENKVKKNWFRENAWKFKMCCIFLNFSFRFWYYLGDVTENHALYSFWPKKKKKITLNILNPRSQDILCIYHCFDSNGMKMNVYMYIWWYKRNTKYRKFVKQKERKGNHRIENKPEQPKTNIVRIVVCKEKSVFSSLCFSSFFLHFTKNS